MSSFLNIAAVSYEGSLFGWEVNEGKDEKRDRRKSGGNGDKKKSKKGDKENEEEDEEHVERLDAKMTYGFHCSNGSLKALAVSRNGKYLVAGGMDERIRIFNVKDNRSLGELGTHTGAITSLKFYEDSYLLSGSEDSTICIWRVHDWLCVHILGGHKAAVNDLSIHPSGMMSLSVSKDNTMKLWNLVQGRCAFTRRLKGSADKVLWDNKGENYILVIGNEIQSYFAADNSCKATIKSRSRVNQALFVSASSSPSESRIAAIFDDKSISLYDLSGSEVSKLDLTCLGGRLRDMWSCFPNVFALESMNMKDALEGEGENIIVATSNGSIAVLSCRSMDSGESLESCLLLETRLRIEPRLTAVVAWGKSKANMSVTNVTMGAGDNSDKTNKTSKRKSETDGEVREGNGDSDDDAGGSSSHGMDKSELKDTKKALKKKKNKKAKNSSEE